MRQINRVRDSIQSLKIREQQLLEKKKSNPRNFKPAFSSEHWRTPEILGSLYAMHGKVCAYCQGTLTHSDRGDVEHYRPKAMYWWLAYSFTNYLLSCARCNRTYKRSKFPLFPNSKRITESDGSNHNHENRKLIDPVLDPVHNWITVSIDAEKLLVTIGINDNPGANTIDKKRCEYTIDFFKLNLNPLLVSDRSDTVLKALELAESGSLDEKQKAKKMASRYSPHGIYVRKILEKKFPLLVPSEKDELYWFIQDLAKELKRCNTILKKYPDSSETINYKKIICWAIASIWKNTSVTTFEEMKEWLTKFKILTFVEGYYNQIP